MAVPKVPGVPALASFATDAIALLTSDLVSGLLGAVEPQWGIFLDGVNVLAADNTVTFSLRQDLPISDYPTENGGFQTYNKVQLPTDIRMRFSAGGDDAARQAFLDSIDAVMNTVDLYDVVTPEKTFVNYNFTHRDFDRAADQGVGLIVVDLWLQEVRTTATSSFSNTQQPGIAGQQSAGAVQPQQSASSFDEAGFIAATQ
jgi:hypothetical protein